MKMWMYLCMCILLVLTGCEHRELSDPDGGHYVRFYLDEQIKNVTCGFYNESYERPEYKKPVTLRVVLTDPASGNVVSESFIRNHGEDERGKYIEGYIGASEGEYNLIAYNFGSAVTLIRNEKNFDQMLAYTNSVSERYLSYLPESRQELDPKKVREQPEHLFHDVGEHIVVKKTHQSDTLRNEAGDYFTAHSLVYSYYLQLKIRGVEYVRSAASTLSGMAGSSYLKGHHDIVKSDSVNLFFLMKTADRQRAQDQRGSTAVLYTTFHTFGKIPEAQSVLTLTFEFIKTDGTSQVETFDITPMFDTPMVKNEQWILLDHEIEIIPPEGSSSGGMTPGVEKWEDVETDVYL